MPNRQIFDNQPKPLAPGVLKTIPLDMQVRDSYSYPLALPGLAANKYEPQFLTDSETLFGSTKAVILYRNVWQYEFSFMGLRQMSIRGEDGQNVNVWYMIYRIRNFGNSFTYDQVKTQFNHTRYELRQAASGGRGADEMKFSGETDQNVDAGSVADLTGARTLATPPENEIHFIPRFSLEGWVEGENRSYQRVGYRDQLHPAVLREIQRREDPNRQLLDTVQMKNAEIPLAQSDNDPGVWGVAVWVGVDPRVDYVSVVGSGLTNAYQLTAADDGSLSRRHRMLQLNFWRPGDAARQDRDLVDFGIPLQDDPADQVEICRRYDLPGPIFRGYYRSPEADQDVLVVEADAEVNLVDFTSAMVPVLDGPLGSDGGKMPPQLVEAFADAGVSIAPDASTARRVSGRQWAFMDAEGREFIVRLEPQYWERANLGGIKFIKRLDHLWIYR